MIAAQMGHTLAHRAGLVDDAIEAFAERAFSFLERLVAAPSLLGEEELAQEVLAEELARIGFEVERLALDEAIAADPAAGVSQRAYAGRRLLVGRRRGEGRSLLVNGHVDVVPPGDAALWSSDPFVPTRRNGRLVGRGAGDMKAGFAMATLAVEALLSVDPGLVGGPLTVVSVLEEECTGNGTLAAGRAGILADAVLLPEPTGLEILLGGAGIIWFELAVQGAAAHASQGGSGPSAIDAALVVVERLRELERELNGEAGTPDRWYALNVGTFHAGDWQSSVPASARVGVRLGFPAGVSPAEAERRVREAVAQAAARHEWLAAHPPAIRFNGFRAEPHELAADHPLALALGEAHRDAHGEAPRSLVGTATTDARFYLNQFDVPALCYGPRAERIHGIDEAVELASIVDGARTLARFVSSWTGGGR
jgi:acetylornithine deacetylase